MSLRDNLNKRFGNPVKDKATFEKNNMVVWNCQQEFPELPFKRMYVNHYLIPLLQSTFKSLKAADLLKEIKTFGGCWIVRPVRGYKNLLSIHSWGIAVDFNVEDNPLGWNREKCIKMNLIPFTTEFLEVWRSTGWIVGYDFKRVDGMHFERTKEFGGDAIF
jgi:D-alanyl-D-alanine carboxypeptidase